jgi:DNA end-binding protein Ku
VKVLGDALVLEIMRFANELVDTKEFNFPARNAIRPQELQMAEQLVANLAEPFDPSRYTDEYRANLMRVIKAKMKGKKPRLEGPEEEARDTDVLDLMSRLRASLEEGGGKKGAVRAKRKAVAASRKPAKAKKRQTA